MPISIQAVETRNDGRFNDYPLWSTSKCWEARKLLEFAVEDFLGVRYSLDCMETCSCRYCDRLKRRLESNELQ